MNIDKKISRLSIMMRVDDRARADIALTADRIYYRFATDESIEDGELPPRGDDFDNLSSELLAAVEAKDNERPLNDEVKLSIFIDNRLSAIEVSEESLRRLVDRLRRVAEEFAFLGGFC